MVNTEKKLQYLEIICIACVQAKKQQLIKKTDILNQYGLNNNLSRRKSYKQHT